MTDPISHASPYLVTALTAAASFMFGLPIGVVISAAGGAYWAVYRIKNISFKKSAWLILCGMVIAAVMVEGVDWLFKHLFGLNDLPHRPLAFMIGFAAIDKGFRDLLIGWLKAKFDALIPTPGDQEKGGKP
jgi:hypothetical protein